MHLPSPRGGIDFYLDMTQQLKEHNLEAHREDKLGRQKGLMVETLNEFNCIIERLHHYVSYPNERATMAKVGQMTAGDLKYQQDQERQVGQVLHEMRDKLGSILQVAAINVELDNGKALRGTTNPLNLGSDSKE